MQASVAPVVYEKYIAWDKLVFGDQIDPYYGVTLPTTQVGFSEANNNIQFFDVISNNYDIRLIFRYITHILHLT